MEDLKITPAIQKHLDKTGQTAEEFFQFIKNQREHYDRMKNIRYRIASKIFEQRKEQQRTCPLEISALFAELEQEYQINYLYSCSGKGKEEDILQERKETDWFLSSRLRRLELEERKKQREEERKNNPDWNKLSKLSLDCYDPESEIMNSFENDTSDHFGF
jgi:hypothetical protein